MGDTTDEANQSLLPSSPTPLLPSLPSSTADYTARLRGWLTYAFASEVFAVCSLGLFLPILLEQFARDNGVLLPDRTVPCVAKIVQGVRVESIEGAEDMRCVVRLGWAWVDTASFSLYVFSTSVAIQALTVISMGGLADHASQRKPLLLSFAALGSLSATLFLLLPSLSPVWPLCALLAILANVAFGASIVALNAYLPGLARDSPEARSAHAEAEEVLKRQSEGEADEDVLASSIALAKWQATVSRTTARISSRGIALGYGAGILALLLLLLPVTLLKGSTFSLRLCVGLTGIWWAAFTLPAGLWLPSAPPPAGKPQPWSYAREIGSAWAQLGRMLLPSNMLKLKHTFLFLAAWFLLSDAFTTISSTAILFGKTALHMPPTSLILVAVLAPSAGVAGALTCNALQHRYGLSNLRVLSLLVLAVTLVPLYGCLGFALPTLGLKTSGEMYALAVYYGWIMGAFQGYARAVFSELIPPGEEARWFGLYSITDKSSSFLGPLVVGIIADRTGNIRYAFFFLIGAVLLPIPLLAGLDMRRGREDAEAFAKARDERGAALEVEEVA
ncbi:MFS general substrate transporter [Calocera viscosa TUFC12733]|uniref:Autophagy-related protein n=1 Tax=Calocera viscosa (strain TUFC12733) TaxID=1330018 RepID=A0A167GNC8_CALVF|nr:MFS general substrate transporter [Calocera viscosa TUFC12733]